MARGKIVTDKQKTDMVKLAGLGMTVREIAEVVGVEFGTVARHIKEANVPKVVEPLGRRMFALLAKSRKKWSLEELSDHFDVGIGKLKHAADELAKEGKNLVLTDGLEVTSLIPKAEPERIDVSKFGGKEYVFGVTGDNHLGSRYARLDVLNALFDLWVDRGVTDVYQCGNMIDGEARFNKFDLLVHGMQGQIDYFIDNWPQRKGITTHYVTGDDHEGWYVQREGVNIGQYMDLCAKKAGREDLKYLGHMEHDVIFKGKENATTMRVIHAGGGTSYAISYKAQKIVESYQGGEKPNILLIGHYHKFDWSFPREVNAIQVGCTEDQTPFMRKLNLQAMVGGVTMGFTMDPYGFYHGLHVKWDPFYDRGFYKKWNYK